MWLELSSWPHAARPGRLDLLDLDPVQVIPSSDAAVTGDLLAACGEEGMEGVAGRGRTDQGSVTRALHRRAGPSSPSGAARRPLMWSLWRSGSPVRARAPPGLRQLTVAVGVRRCSHPTLAEQRRTDAVSDD